MRRRTVLQMGFAAALVAVSPAQAQNFGTVQSPVLTVDSETIYVRSAYGRRVAEMIREEGEKLAAENRAIEADLTAEEQRLTDLRATTEPEAFRQLADEFDEKVRRIRREQDTKASALSRRQGERREGFLRAAAPILEDLMREAGAAVVLERRSVFLSLNAIDITDAAIERIDAAIGDGSEAE